ncbi:MAG: NAD(P)/FAD-dependent oxidoreductase, partial [Alphaproteobacteria bacterium]
NERTYPNLISLFRQLGVATEASDMSFSVSVADGKFEYAGASKLRGLFAQGSNVVSPRFWALLGEILRYYRAHRGRGADAGLEHVSLRQLLDAGGYSEDFRKLHLLPMAAAIWSGTMDSLLDYPAASFLRFCDNHGLLQVARRPRWRTVTGGSRRYVQAMAASMACVVHTATPVTSILRAAGQTRLFTERFGWQGFDHVVVAAHGDQALRMLADADGRERAILGAFAYQPNRAVLHRDPALMPVRKAAWASWNYLADWNDQGNPDAGSPVSVTYWLNRLQNLPANSPLFLSLNPLREPQPDLVERRFAYEHPQFDLAALNAQRRLDDIQGVRGTWFCGSYCGHGFHEDALRAGIAVARALGADVPWTTDVAPAGSTSARARALEWARAA